MKSFIRLEMLIGSDNMKRLQDAHVMIFGIGGVGGYVAESLARSGIGKLTLVDFDSVAESNINRQIHATVETIDRLKGDAMKERIALINPNCQVLLRFEKYTKDNGEDFFRESPDFVADAIDMVTSKLDLICRCRDKGIPVISAMGTGNKLFPELLEITDLSKTENCPLARVMRRELKKRGIRKLPVVYSKELPLRPQPLEDEKLHETPGSTSFVPSTAGLYMASYIVRELIELDTLKRKGQ